MQITTSWHEKGRAEGRAEGRVEGRVEKAREIICKYLSRKFGDRSAGLQQKVGRMTDLETLDCILEQLFAANSLEEARAIINNGVKGDKLPAPPLPQRALDRGAGDGQSDGGRGGNLRAQRGEHLRA